MESKPVEKEPTSDGKPDEGDRDESAGAETPSSSSRWWEQYTVRYFVGTVLGALILGVLILSLPDKSTWMPITPTMVKNLDPKAITALAAIGLAYCYVASAPILTFHAVRGAFRVDKDNGWLALIFLIGGTLVLYVAVKVGLSAFAGWVALGAVIGLQIAVIAVANQKSFESIKKFYQHLVIARGDARVRKTDYVDSYRHLREHGNALGIVFFELVLGFILATVEAEGEAEIGLAIAVWVLPGAWSWLIGCVIESDFVEKCPVNAETPR